MRKYYQSSIRRQDSFMWGAKKAFCALLVIACLLGGVILYLEKSTSDPESQTAINSKSKEISLPLLGDSSDVVLSEQEQSSESGLAEGGVHQGVIEPGSTASSLLQEWLSSEEISLLVSSSASVYSLQQVKAGNAFQVVCDEDGFCRFEYEINDLEKLVVVKENEAFNASLEPIHYDRVLELVEGTITASLFEAMGKAGESPALAERLATVFAWEINFIRDLQPGDSFKVLVEKRYRDGELRGYGKLLAAEFVNQGKVYEGFLFKDSTGHPAYYNSRGESVKRAFLKAPLSFTRISSPFTNKRFHPILKTWKSHPAIDYAAPIGTPVKAIGNGVATFVGSDKGAGNYIKLQHSQGYESMYLHLSRFAKGLKKGSKVRQGEIIGYVGSTGYSTGPHLDFRMKKNGEYINPAQSMSPRSEPLSGKEKELFFRQNEEYRKYLRKEKPLTDYVLQKDAS